MIMMMMSKFTLRPSCEKHSAHKQKHEMMHQRKLELFYINIQMDCLLMVRVCLQMLVQQVS